MNIIEREFLDELSSEACRDIRKRKNFNLHKTHSEACQRLFNAIEPESYIRPHRHLSDPKDEMLIAMRGLMALIIFRDDGSIAEVLQIGSDKYGNDVAVGAEVSPHTWHTVVALEPGSVLLEVKAGPFDVNRPKDLAAWAPEEGSHNVDKYLQNLLRNILDWEKLSAPHMAFRR